MVMQLTRVFTVGSSNPGRADMAPLTTVVDKPGFEPPIENFAVDCVTIRPAFGVTTLCLPTAWSLLSENF